MTSLGSNLLQWFKAHNGVFDEQHMQLAEIEGCGTGAIAVKDISKGHVLFEIPRELLLSTRTCTLKSRLTHEEWTGLGKGWTPLILCMMWEAAKGAESNWSGYLETMPVSFDTPMFWPETDLEELRGTTIAEKIGREDADKEYIERLLPLVRSRPDVFNPAHLDTYYTLAEFHIMGSRILSRSFHVEPWKGEQEQHEDPDTSMESHHSMDVNQPREEINGQQDAHLEEDAEEHGNDSDNDSEDGERVEDVSMVPMADMLNAKYGGENAKLFYEPHVLKMITTKHIPAGEQIWNTYGDPPNSDLLRRYGYVDELGSGLDIVEIKGSTIVECAGSGLPAEDRKKRVDWWLEMGGDDTFTLEISSPLPPELLSFAELMLLSEPEWKRAQEKEKPPKPKSPNVNQCVRGALTRRLGMYPTTLEDDETELKSGHHTLNKRHALVIRTGEKRVLKAALESIPDSGPKKRKADSEAGAKKKGARQR